MKERIIYISIIFVLLVAVGLSMRTCSSKSQQVRESRQNIEALLDVTHQVMNKADKLQFERTIFMGDIETLKKLNAGLIKEVEDQKGKTRVITRIDTKVVLDTVYVDNRVSKKNDSSFVISFSYSKTYDSLNSVAFRGSVPAEVQTSSDGYVLRSSTTTVTDLSMRMRILTGIKEESGSYKIFARTDFPGVKFDLDGAVIDPEKSFSKRRTSPFSLMVGGGIGYGLTQSGVSIVPNVGLYVGINLFNF